MTVIVTRAGKGSPLTNAEVDANFTGLNADKEAIANKGVANGYASLDATGKVPAAQLPSYVDDVLEFANLAAFPGTGEAGKIYVALDTNKTYRCSGSAYIYITSGAVDSVAGKTGVVVLAKADVGLGNVDNTSDANKPVSTAQQAALDGKSNVGHNHDTAYEAKNANIQAHIASVANPHGVTKAQVGLGNVDNTADIAKPVSTAQQAALDAKAPLASPSFTGPVVVGANVKNAPLTDNDLSFDLTAKNNFTCTPTGAGTLTFTNIASCAGQSGTILLVNGSNYAISKASTTKTDSSFLATVSATGTYRLSYYCDGTNVYVTTSGALS